MDICLTSKQTEGLVTLVVKVISARNLGEKEELDHLYPYIVRFFIFFFLKQIKHTKSINLVCIVIPSCMYTNITLNA